MIDGLTLLFLFVVLVLFVALVGDVVLDWFDRKDPKDQDNVDSTFPH